MRNPLVQLHLAVFLWGFTGVLGRLIHLNEGLLVWYRLLITIITLFFFMYWKGTLQILNGKQIVHLFFAGSIIAIHWVFFYGSIKAANVSIALTCLSSAGLFTALLEPLLNHSKWKLQDIGLGCLGIAGIALIFHFDGHFKLGIVYGLIATLLSVLFSIYNKRIVQSFHPQTMILYELTGGWLCLSILLPVYLWYFPTNQYFPSLPDSGWLVVLSWGCTIIAMDLSFRALKKVSVFTQNLTLNLEPVYGILLAFMIYQENRELGTSFYLGFGLILLSVTLQTWRVVKKKS